MDPRRRSVDSVGERLSVHLDDWELLPLRSSGRLATAVYPSDGKRFNPYEYKNTVQSISIPASERLQDQSNRLQAFRQKPKKEMTWIILRHTTASFNRKSANSDLCHLQSYLPAFLREAIWLLFIFGHGFFSALLGFYFHLVTHGFFLNPVHGSFLTLYRVPFPPCAGFLFHPVQGSFSTLCTVPFPPCAGFLFHTAQAPCAGFSLCRVPFPPCAGFLFRVPFPLCAGILFHPVQGSFSTLCRVLFPPCARFFFHPVQDSFSGFLFHSVQGSFSTLCRVPFPPCAGFFFHLRRLRFPHCAGTRFPLCAGILFHPVQGSFSTLAGFLFHPVQNSLSTLCRVPF